MLTLMVSVRSQENCLYDCQDRGGCSVSILRIIV